MNKDKIYHSAVGFSIVFLTTIAVWLSIFGMSHAAPTLIQMVLAAGAGRCLAHAAAWFKEAYDEAHSESHTKDVLDGEVTKAGADLATALSIVVALVLHG